MRNSIILVSMILLAATAPELSAQENGKSLEELENEEFLLGGTYFERLERFVQSRKIECMRAFPHEQFCSCLAGELPMAINMTQYTLVLTTPKDVYGYNDVTEEKRQAIDATFQVREHCSEVVSE